MLISENSAVTIHLYHTVLELVRRIEKNDFEGRTLTLKVKFLDFQQITRSITVDHILRTKDDILPLAKQLMQGVEFHSHPIRLLGLGVNWSLSRGQRLDLHHAIRHIIPKEAPACIAGRGYSCSEFFKAMLSSNLLRDLNGLGDLLLLLGLWHGDSQDAVLHLGRDLVSHDIIRQRVVLLVVRVAELAAQIVVVLVLMLVLSLVLDGDGQLALVVDANSAIFFLNAWSCKFHRVGLLTLLDIDCSQEIVKYCWEPTVFKHYW